MRVLVAPLFFFLLGVGTVRAQPSAKLGFTRYSFHDAAKKNVKEVYQVRDTISNTPHGTYISYFLNGNIESKGQFSNGETIGVWEFYFETGGLKMRGIVRQNSNYGLWEYFYENGNKSMEGVIQGKSKESHEPSSERPLPLVETHGQEADKFLNLNLTKIK